MTHATFMPTVVFPDTERGRGDANHWDTSEITVKRLCGDYSAYKDGICENRNPLGDPSHNMCNRCMYGFMFDVDRLGLVPK